MEVSYYTESGKPLTNFNQHDVVAVGGMLRENVCPLARTQHSLHKKNIFQKIRNIFCLSETNFTSATIAVCTYNRRKQHLFVKGTNASYQLKTEVVQFLAKILLQWNPAFRSPRYCGHFILSRRNAYTFSYKKTL